MKQLTDRQTSLILFVTTIALKLLVLPSLLIGTSQNSVWLVLIIMFAIDALLLTLVLAVVRAFPEQTFSQVLQKLVGKVGTKIVLCVLGLLFLLKLSMLMRECFEFYAETSYVDFSWIVYLVPLILVLGYATSSSLRALGRSIEIFFYFIILSVVMAILFSVSSIDIFAILPLVPNGISPILKALLDYAFWFGDFLIIAMLMGNIKLQNNSLKKMFLSYFCAMIVVFVVVTIHFSLFGSVSTTYKTSLVDITEYIPRITTSGRFTWIVLLLYPITLIFAMMVYSKFAIICFFDGLKLKQKHTKMLAYFVVLASVGILALTQFSQNLLIEVITKYLKYGVLAVQIVVPLMLVLTLTKQSKKGIENEKFVKQNLEK